MNAYIAIIFTYWIHYLLYIFISLPIIYIICPLQYRRIFAGWTCIQISIELDRIRIIILSVVLTNKNWYPKTEYYLFSFYPFYPFYRVRYQGERYSCEAIFHFKKDILQIHYFEKYNQNHSFETMVLINIAMLNINWRCLTSL